MIDVSNWWLALSSDVQAALIGGGCTIAAAMFGVLAVTAQIRSQARQGRAAIAEGERRKIKAALYEDGVIVCRFVADAAIALSTKIRLMNLDLEVAARAEAARIAYSLPSTRFPLLSGLYEEFTDAALRFVFLVENRRIVDPRLLVFRTAMSTVLHDSRQLMFSDFVLHVMPLLPTDRPEGGVYPYKPPTVDGAQTAARFGNRLIAALDDAVAYADDFLTEMQNALLGDLFDSRLETRRPLDPDRQVVTLERAAELEKWFRESTGWGREVGKADAAAQNRFRPNQLER